MWERWVTSHQPGVRKVEWLGEWEDEPEVEVTFDTTAFVETPLTEGCKKIMQLEMEMKKVEKNEELLKMKKAAYARELSMEKEKLKKTLAME